jgi:hypothetical protein
MALRLNKGLSFWLMWAFAVALLATPAFAQDDSDSTPGGDGDDFFSNEPFPAAPTVPERDVLGDIRNWLKKSNASPMDSKQEKALKKLYDKEVKAMAKTFEKRFGESLESALAAQTMTRGRRGQMVLRAKPEHTAAICKMSAQLVDKVIAGLKVDQQATLRKYQSEQIRISKSSLLERNLESAGIPLTAEQKRQVEDLFARESRLRTLMIVEARGEPYQARTTPLEAQTTQRVASLLEPPQVKVLVETIAISKKSQAGTCSGT